MTRKEAQLKLLAWLDEYIITENASIEDVFIKSPHKGKNTWTLGEYIEAAKQDRPLNGLEGETKQTPVDDILNLEKHLKGKEDR